MKVLIWVLGYLVMSYAYVLIPPLSKHATESIGFINWLEAILYFMAWILVSKALCKLWDKHKKKK